MAIQNERWNINENQAEKKKESEQSTGCLEQFFVTIASFCSNSSAKQLIFRMDYIEDIPFSYVKVGLLEKMHFYLLFRCE